MATGLLSYFMVARHGYAIERLKREMAAEPERDDFVRFLAQDAANFVYGFLLTSGNNVLATDRTIRNDISAAIAATLAKHGIDERTFVLWPEIHGQPALPTAAS